MSAALEERFTLGALRLREKIQPFGFNPQSAGGGAPLGSKSRSLSLAVGETLD